VLPQINPVPDQVMPAIAALAVKAFDIAVVALIFTALS
jgi:hypothetical protein